jgi:hypothetical protein
VRRLRRDGNAVRVIAAPVVGSIVTEAELRAYVATQSVRR